MGAFRGAGCASRLGMTKMTKRVYDAETGAVLEGRPSAALVKASLATAGGVTAYLSRHLTPPTWMVLAADVPGIQRVADALGVTLVDVYVLEVAVETP